MYLGARQRKIFDFVVALDKVEESMKDPTPVGRDKAYTLVRAKVRKFEDLTRAKKMKIRSPGLRSLGKAWEKGGKDSKDNLAKHGDEEEERAKKAKFDAGAGGAGIARNEEN